VLCTSFRGFGLVRFFLMFLKDVRYGKNSNIVKFKISVSSYFNIFRNGMANLNF